MTSARATNCSALPQATSHPVRVNQIPRQIPPQPKYLRPWVREAFPCSSRNALTGRPIAGRDDPRWHPSVRYVIFANSLRLGGLTSNRAGAAFIELYFVLSSLFASRDATSDRRRHCVAERQRVLFCSRLPSPYPPSPTVVHRRTPCPTLHHAEPLLAIV